MPEGRFDLLILDLTMPGDDGLTLTRELRQTSEVGIIILTGKEGNVERVVGLELGAEFRRHVGRDRDAARPAMGIESERRGILAKPELTHTDKERLATLEEKIGPLPAGESPEDIRTSELLRESLRLMQSRQGKQTR